MKRIPLIAAVLALLLAGGCEKKQPEPQAPAATTTKTTAAAEAITPAEARAIAKEAYVYGFPLVDNYRIIYSYFVDTTGPEYKGAWNQVHSTARLFTPADKAVQTPNSDTPYSMLGADLRAEPLVLSMPAVKDKRYFSAQFIDLYTFNFAYAGSRTTGDKGGHFLLAGPGWSGEKPPGIDAVFKSETDLALVIYRTQLFDPKDIDNVKRVQAGYKVQPLSAFLGQPAPPSAPPIDFPKPLTPDQERSSPDFFKQLNFVLRFGPVHPSETELMARFKKLGIGADGDFETGKLSPNLRKAVEDGMADAWKDYDALRQRINAGEIHTSDMIGNRESLHNNYLYRMGVAVDGIYGNSKEEALYPLYFVDAEGQPLDAAKHRYTLRFAPKQLPPVNAFWSVTMYELPSKLLSENPLHRYLINSPMLPKLKRDKDGGVTLYIQHESPGKAKEANWLPAPNGPFYAAMRLYWPKPEALSGEWKAPPLQRQP